MKTMRQPNEYEMKKRQMELKEKYIFTKNKSGLSFRFLNRALVAKYGEVITK